MKHVILVLVPASFALVVACSSGDDGSAKKDTAATEPGTSSGASGAATSGGSPSTSGGTPSTSGGTPSTSGGTPSTSGGTDAGSDGPATNCVAKGSMGNDKHVGAYCDKDVSCPFQVDPFLVCTYGHDPTNTHLFCTAPCSKDSECGTGAFCVHDPQGNGCVPMACGGAPGM